MKYAALLIAAIILCAQCRRAASVQPAGNYDTLGVHWTTVEGANITYYFQDFSVQSAYATQYVNLHENAYTELNRTFNAVLPRKLRFFVWKDANLGAQLLNSPLGFTDPYHCICYVRPEQTIGHEMTHALSYWAWGSTPTAETRFINEGVAVAFDLTTGDRMAEAKAAIAGQGITSISDLWYGKFQKSPEDFFYPVAGAFVEFLYKQGETAQFDSLIKDQRFETAQRVYGIDRFNSLITSFDRSIGL